MQDGVLAAATTTSHSDHQVRNVSLRIVQRWHFFCVLTPVATGLRVADEGCRCICQAFTLRLRHFHRRGGPQGQHVQVTSVVHDFVAFVHQASLLFLCSPQRHDGSGAAVATR